MRCSLNERQVQQVCINVVMFFSILCVHAFQIVYAQIALSIYQTNFVTEKF